MCVFFVGGGGGGGGGSEVGREERGYVPHQCFYSHDDADGFGVGRLSCLRTVMRRWR